MGDRYHPSESISSLGILAARQVFQQKEQPEAQGCVPGGEGSASWLQWGERGQKGSLEGSWGSWCVWGGKSWLPRESGLYIIG